MTPTVRRADVGDAEAAARCHVACWREAYAHLAEPDALARRTADLATRIERWRTFASHEPPRWLAVDGDEVVGFSAAGPGRDDDLRTDAPDLVELYALYVRASAYGTGLGERLLRAAIGGAPAFLWVFEANARARAFYARYGFTADGRSKHDPAFGAVEIRLVRAGV